MLVLSQRESEKIFVGPNICITVVQIGHNSVRIGIDAPREVVVVREEVAGRSRESDDGKRQ